MKQIIIGLILAFCQTTAGNAQVIDTVLNKTSQKPQRSGAGKTEAS